MANEKCYKFTFTWPVTIKLDIRVVYEKSYVANEVRYIFTSTNITNNNKLKRIKNVLKSIILRLYNLCFLISSTDIVKYLWL